MESTQTVNTIYTHTDVDPHDRKDPNVARLTINENKVLESNTVPGLTVEVKELPDGVDIKMELEDHRVIEKPVHLCFGVIPEKGVQRIVLDVVIVVRVIQAAFLAKRRAYFIGARATLDAQDHPMILFLKTPV